MTMVTPSSLQRGPCRHDRQRDIAPVRCGCCKPHGLKPAAATPSLGVSSGLASLSLSAQGPTAQPASPFAATNSGSEQVATVNQLLLSTTFRPSQPVSLTAGNQPLTSSVASPQAHDAVFASAAPAVNSAVSSPIFDEPHRIIGPMRSTNPATTALDELLANFNWPLG